MADKQDAAELDPEVLRDPLEDTDSAAGGDSRAAQGEVEQRPQVHADRSGGPAVLEERALAPVDPFRRYLAEIRKYPPLSREQEQELARRYRETGDREALFRLVTSNLMLVVRIALSFRRATRNLLDLIQEGNVGLLQAIEKFDPGLGVRLPTYAAWWIRAYMVKYLMDNIRLVRVGTTNARRKLLHNLAEEKRKLEALGYEVGPKLLAERFGVSEEDVRDVQQALSSRDVSLDEPVTEDEKRSREETLPADETDLEEEVARRELQRKTQQVLRKFRATLNERERTILDRRIVAEDPATLQELGDLFGITREAVRQSEARVMKKLKAFLLDELGDAAEIRFGPAP